ncbi:MAG TPA: MBL fold metallo-hydrolase [Acidimicrobiales bacterium]|nr:MBL fold metallo-hydrolase [Acidimicrobiales bacterium]
MSGDHGAASAELPPPITAEVAEGVFAYVQPDGSWWINNTGFVVGDRDVCAVDASSTEARTRAFRRSIAERTPLPVRTLINTHHHGDHTNGNCLFGGATIVGHTNCRDNMAGQRVGGLDAVFGPVAWGELTVVPPAVTFDDALVVHAGDLRLEVLYAGTPAHTTGDAVVWVPERRVLFAGDLLFNGGTPFVLMGSVAGSLAALDRLRSLPVATVVPGHGPVAGPELIDAVEGYLRWLQGLAAEARAAGLSPLDAARQADLGEWAGLLDPERIVGNLYRAYSELDGAPLGAPVDVMAAFTDMIAFNGGRPLRCLA